MNPPAAVPETDPRSRFIVTGNVLLLAALALGLLAFAGTLRFQFTYDDWPQIVNNPAIRSLKSVPDYFVHNVWHQVAPDSRSKYYRPVFLLWLLLNFKLFALRAWAWHLTTLLTHLVATALVYKLARRYMDFVPAGMAAILFAVHPVHIESVAWISGVTEPLMAVFFLTSILLYIDAPRMGSWRYATSVLCYALALLTKETGIVLPGLLLGYEFMGERQGRRHLLRLAQRMAPFAMIALAYLGVRQMVFAGFAHSDDLVPWRETLLLQPVLLSKYLWKLVWPFGLSIFYDVPLVRSVASVRFLLPLATLAALASAVVWAMARSRARLNALLPALLWILLPLLPPLVGVRYFEEHEFFHDRYLYLPSIGLALLTGWLITKLPQSKKAFGIPATQLAAILAVAMVLSTGTAVQSVYWTNNLLLYLHGVQCAPRNLMARNLLANELYKRGDSDAALRTYKEALSINPNYWKTNFDLGITYMGLGQNDRAEYYLVRAKSIAAKNANHDYFIGLVQFREGKFPEAEQSLKRAVVISPEVYEVRWVLGEILTAESKYDDAAVQFREALRLRPGDRNAVDELAKLQALGEKR